jgi:hypothetical protein
MGNIGSLGSRERVWIVLFGYVGTSEVRLGGRRFSRVVGRCGGLLES